MSNVVKWGILGTAGIARKAVVPAILRAENAEVMAVASSSNKQKAEEFADLFDIPKRYGSYEELLDDQEIQAVYIPLPNHLHATWVKKAAEKGKHILCEKPVSLTEKETKSMIEVCEQNNVVFMEAFMYQFHPQHQRVKELIESETIGEVTSMRSAFSFFMDVEAQAQNIRLNREFGGGSLFDIGCYCLHVSQYILEKEPNQVYVSGHIPPEFGVDLTAAGILSFEGGITASFSCSFQQPFENHYTIIGTKGRIDVPAAFRPDVTEGDGRIIVTNQNGETTEERLSGDQYVLQIEHLSTCVLTGETPIYDNEAMLKNMKVLEACHKSLHENRQITL
ncbi:Gfo/Idh/MocA family oxidoreductase [Alkalihalobacillus sp. MEB130]|uniref:Gfo/Idh/MocA family oxidoreductase n=1 Tax=Alkalihalobacillus sp. MEB130 TaxID=2976704 RepID=UPI0028DE9B04|nr:Gfo/Idh/MocA family oxidoreductase [Alkalihalobacillus sp. MEB130]MDT8860905.1 Gfo/Idh/MocA family oxidoreductase [Alkalihalobacillus sp. MEB130]